MGKITKQKHRHIKRITNELTDQIWRDKKFEVNLIDGKAVWKFSN